MASEVIHDQRHSSLVAAAAQLPFVQRFLTSSNFLLHTLDCFVMLSQVEMKKLNSNIYICASEHTFNFSLSSVLLIKSLAQKRGFLFCSQIGGCESIRDIRQSKVIGVDAIECGFVESVFAYKKLCNSVNATWSSSNTLALDMKQPNALFLTIHRISAIEGFIDILAYHQEKKPLHHLIPVLDRRSIAKDIYEIQGENFDLVDYEDDLNQKLSNYEVLRSASIGVSGGMTSASVNKIINTGLKPSYIKTGLFILKIQNAGVGEIKHSVESLQLTEAIILEALRAANLDQFNFSSRRQTRLLLELMGKEGV